jgi:hypothetical protein
MKKLSVLFVLLLLTSQIHAEPVRGDVSKSLTLYKVGKERSIEPPPPSIQLKMEKFFLKVQAGEVKKGFADLLEETEYRNQSELADSFVSDTQKAVKLYGAPQGYELFDNQKYGNRLKVVTYLLYLEAKPLRWRMVFYATKDLSSWRLINLRVDDLFDESILQN